MESRCVLIRFRQRDDFHLTERPTVKHRIGRAARLTEAVWYVDRWIAGEIRHVEMALRWRLRPRRLAASGRRRIAAAAATAAGRSAHAVVVRRDDVDVDVRRRLGELYHHHRPRALRLQVLNSGDQTA